MTKLAELPVNTHAETLAVVTRQAQEVFGHKNVQPAMHYGSMVCVQVAGKYLVTPVPGNHAQPKWHLVYATDLFLPHLLRILKQPVTCLNDVHEAVNEFRQRTKPHRPRGGL